MIIKHSVSTGDGIKVETLPAWVSGKTKVAATDAAEEAQEGADKIRDLNENAVQIDDSQDFEGV